MNIKIIGATVGSPLPKPNLMQTDPTKGDYVKGKEEFLEQFDSSVNYFVITGEYSSTDGNMTGAGQVDKTIDEIRNVMTNEGRIPILLLNGMVLSYCGSTDTTEKFYQWLSRENNGVVEYELLEAQIGAPNTVIFKSTVGDLGDGQNSGGNADFQTDETLTLKNGVLSVNTTNNMEQDNTLPITSAGVYATVGNIEALLKTI